MKERIKTIAAILVILIMVAVGFILDMNDKTADVYPDDNTFIRLYGEAHGAKMYYDIELDLWKDYYAEGYRDLFVELPYYSAEFLNVWMKEDSDELIDKFFEEIQGTQSGNEYYNEFFHEIKAQCPETIFHGTDVGHQYDTTGARYLEYLKDHDLADSENYKRAEECIRQGKEYRSDDTPHNGISPVREAYMTSNFIDEYSSVGGKIMGIYGGYHTQLNNPDLMAGRIREHFGDIISSVNLSSIAFSPDKNPYKLGFCFTGVVFLLMLFIPNMVWGIKGKPEGYDDMIEAEHKFLLTMERIGEVLVTVSLLIFTAINPQIKKLPEGVYFKWTVIIWLTSFVLMILYECYWIKYFKSQRRLQDFYSSFAGFPLAGATLPVIAVFLLGLYSGNIILICASLVLGIGHIGIHMVHRESCNEEC